MKTITKISAAVLLAAGFAASAFGQIQVAGTLQVDLDAAALPVGPVGTITNAALAGSVFQSHTNAGLGPQVIALGGNGTHGILFDGNSLLAQEDGLGNPVFPEAALTSAGFSGFSVEAWVFAPTIIDDNPVISWGTRNAGCGSQVSCAYGASSSYGGLAMWCYDHGWGPGGTPVAGKWHHLAWTLDASGNENLYADGVLKAAYTGVAPNIDPNNQILIGASHGSTGGTLDGITGGFILGRVRVHDGILTSLQVSNNYAYEAATFTNGTPTFLTSKPLHRYSFINAATNDAVGLTVVDRGTASNTVNAVNAVVKGVYGGATASFSGAQLTLSGGSSTSAPYVELPNPVISVLSTNQGGSGQVTLETWVNLGGSHPWARIFDFGSNTLGRVTGVTTSSFSGLAYVNLVGTPGNPADLNNEAFGFASGNYTFKSRPTGSMTHVAVTWDDTTGLVNVFENGIQVMTYAVTNRMNDIMDINNWLGRSNWSSDDNMQGSFSEFRVYNRIVSAAELLNDYQVGPTVIDPVQKWNGNLSGDWDINTTANWLTGTSPVKYTDAGGPVQFDDTLTGTANVNLTTVVQPQPSLTVNNSLSNYVFSGSGSISGSVGLTKYGTGSLAINNVNNYTGVTTLQGGTVAVTNLANGGSPSAIGAASAASGNLAFAGGTLSYRGPAVAIDRGYTVTGNSTLDVQGDLTLSGPITASSGSFTKSGAATLTYTGNGVKKLTAGTLYVNNGTLVLDGSSGAQTNLVSGDLWVGSDQTHGAAMILTNTTLTNTTWLAIGRGNGTGGLTSSLTLYNSKHSIGNLSLGYDAGIVGNNQTANLTLNGTSQLINIGGTGAQIGESSGSTGNLLINDSAWFYSQNRILLAPATGATGVVVVANSGAITNSGYVSVGSRGNATVTLKNNAVWQALTDFNITDLDGTSTQPSLCTVNLMDNAMLRVSTLYVGKGQYCTATINQSGGSILNSGGGDWRVGGNVSGGANELGIWNLSGGSVTCANNFQIGAYGTGYFNQSGGAVYCTGGYPDIGRFMGGVGYLNISGGNFYSLANRMLVGEQGSGTVNVSGTGSLNCAGTGGSDGNTGLILGLTSTGIGTLNVTNGSVNVTNNLMFGRDAGAQGYINLYAGVLATKKLYMNNASASSYINFYGGTLKAMPGAAANFMSGLSSATIYSGGAIIDSDTNAITIAQDFYDGGSGSLTKLGAGTLTLSGNQYYFGPLAVNAGKVQLATTGVSLNMSGIAVADGADLGVQVTQASGQVAPSSVTLGATNGASLDFDLGTYGSTTTAPLSVAGTLTVNGTTTVNVAGTGLAIGQYPLVQYVARAGAGSFVVGSLPAGVAATIVTNVPNNSIDLNITAVNLLLWSGLSGGTWDINLTANWLSAGNGQPAYYLDNSSVVFNDTAQGTTTVNLTTNVLPHMVTIMNDASNYTLVGNGMINGPISINKQGAASFALFNTNGYTGSTIVSGGTLVVSNLANGGVNSAIGAASSNPTNLVLNGGNLTYTGPAVAIDRGYSVQSTNNGITTTGNLTLSGLVTAGSGAGFTKTGLGMLAYVTAGSNVLAGPASSGYIVNDGSLIFDGSNGGQTNQIGGDRLGVDGVNSIAQALMTNAVVNLDGNLDLGNQTNTSGTLTVDGNSTLNVAGWLIFGDGGNGTNTLTLNQGTVNVVNGGKILMGGRAGGVSTLNLNDGILNNAGGQAFDIADGNWNGSGARTATVNQSGGTNNCNNGMSIGNAAAGTGSYNLTNGLLNVAGEIDVGNGGALGTLNILNGTLNANNWFVVGRAGSTDCSLNMTGGTINKNGNGSFIIASGAGNNSIANSATFNISGGTVNSSGEFWIAENNLSTGTNNISGSAVINVHNWVSVGRMGLGVVNMSGGQFNADTHAFIVGIWAGSQGIWNQSGGSLMINNELWIAQGDLTAQGILNLNGGTITNTSWLAVGREGGSGVFNINGGTYVRSGAGGGINGPNVSIAHGGGTGTVNVNSGYVDVSAGDTWIGEDSNTGTWNMNGGVAKLGLIQLARNSSASGILALNGGRLTATEITTGNTGAAQRELDLNGGTLVAGADNANFIHDLSAANVQLGGAIFDTAGHTVAVNQALLEGGGTLTKLGAGTLVLAGANTYSSMTTVSNGTLAVNGIVSGPVTVAGGTLAGIGTINGAVTVNPSATLAPGNGLGTLTNNNTMTLQGAAVMEISRNSGVLTSDQVTGLSQVNYGGTLTVNNVGPDSLHVGDTFQLFSAGAYNGTFSAVNLPTAYTWANNLAANGTIQVTAVNVNTTPTNLVTSVSSNQLTISWPADHTGWTLQSNAVSLVNSAAWFDVPGSSSTNQVIINVSPAQTNVFYRLKF